MTLFDISVNGVPITSVLGLAVLRTGRFHFFDGVLVTEEVASELSDTDLAAMVRAALGALPAARIEDERERAHFATSLAPSAASPKRERPSNLYLMKANSIFKIGIGKDVSSRRKALATASGYAVEVVASWPTRSQSEARDIEASWHEWFREKRLAGEWFALTDGDVAHMNDRMQEGRPT